MKKRLIIGYIIYIVIDAITHVDGFNISDSIRNWILGVIFGVCIIMTLYDKAQHQYKKSSKTTKSESPPLAEQPDEVGSHFEPEYEPELIYVDALQAAYNQLGVPYGDNMVNVKYAYRKLMSEYHPDKLESRGLSIQELLRAKELTQTFNNAYDLICKAL